MLTIANIVNIIITILFIILVISERDNPKKLPIALCTISILLTILSFVL
nr:MAG TPA: hypothetical protein [Caudoviricetes sp.]